jgi:phospholipase/lecithinase/hemolysin
MPPGVVIYDLKGLLDQVVAQPASYGLTNVTDMACDPVKA